MNRSVTASYDPDGNVVTQTLTGGGVTQTETMTYNAMDQDLSQTIDNTRREPDHQLMRDQRGLVTSETDPAEQHHHDRERRGGPAGVVTGPAVLSQTGNGARPSPPTRSR